MGAIQEKVKEIKQSFRQIMDGHVAHSMRDKGAEYHLNWGATLPRLHEMADEYGKNYDLAIALWKEDIRECKILATLIMPAESMLPGVCDIWMEQVSTQEIAEQVASTYGSTCLTPLRKHINGLLQTRNTISCVAFIF